MDYPSFNPFSKFALIPESKTVMLMLLSSIILSFQVTFTEHLLRVGHCAEYQRTQAGSYSHCVKLIKSIILFKKLEMAFYYAVSASSLTLTFPSLHQACEPHWRYRKESLLSQVLETLPHAVSSESTALGICCSLVNVEP